MTHTCTFYAIDAQAFARQLLHSAGEVLAKVESRIREQGYSNPVWIKRILDAVDVLCRGELPSDCGFEYFLGLCWVAGAAWEPVTICSFQDFRRLSYLEEIGVWPWLQRRAPPFPVPRCREEAPQVGFLAVEDIETFALAEFSHLPKSVERDVLNARDEFRDVLDSLVVDHLDLLAVLT